MDESDQSHIKCCAYEESWQIVRKQGAVYINGMITITPKKNERVLRKLNLIL